MKISEAQSRCGLPAKTLRYYEDIALVTPDRQGNGYRNYSDRHIHELRFLKCARSLGFSVEGCRALLELYRDSDRDGADVKRASQARMAEVDRKIDALRAMRRTLGALVRSCGGTSRPDCPILDDLALPAGADELHASNTPRETKHRRRVTSPLRSSRRAMR